MTKVELYSINSVQPDSFVDFFVTEEEPIYDGTFEVSLETSDFHELKDDPTFRQREVQKISYPKYKLTIPDSQESFLELIKLSRKVLIIQDDLANQEAIITDVNRTFTNKMWVVTIEYYDRAINNYKGVVAEYLKSEWLKSTDQDIEKYSLFYDDTNYIVTRLKPTVNYPDPESVDLEIDDIKVITKSIQPEAVHCVFYCSELEVQALKQNEFKYLLRLSPYGTAVEITQSTVEKLGGWDIYKVELDFVYNKLKYNI